MPTSRNKNLPRFISVAINKGGLTKLKNFIREQKIGSNLVNNVRGGPNPYYFNIRPTHTETPNGNLKPTGIYKLMSWHKSSAKKTQANITEREKRIMKAIKNFILQQPKTRLENLNRYHRSFGKMNNTSEGSTAKVLGNPNILRLIYKQNTRRNMNENKKIVSRAKTAASMFNNASARHFR
jgi:hypothetical protein